jgi:hypothetical protein
VTKPGVTQELRARVNAHMAAESRQRVLVATAVTIAAVAICVYLAIRWLA